MKNLFIFILGTALIAVSLVLFFMPSFILNLAGVLWAITLYISADLFGGWWIVYFQIWRAIAREIRYFINTI